MKRLSESIWSDMQDRSIGEKTRKEDDIELLDRDGFYDYLVNHYEELYPELPGIQNFNTSDMIVIPMLKSQYGKNFKLAIWKVDEPKETFITMPREQPFWGSDLFGKLREKYKLIAYDDLSPKFKIEPQNERDFINIKTGGFYKRFFIYVIDTILELNTEYKSLIKKK